jgi:HK97 family phage major capsid protein
MKSLEELGSIERVQRLNDFAKLCRILAIAKGNAFEALDTATRYGASQRVQDVLKASVAAGGAGGVGAWGEQTAVERLVLGAFSDALKHSSAFARMVADGAITRVPLEPATLGLVATTAGAGAIVVPGQSIPVRRMDFSQKSVARRKAAEMVVLTDELLRQAPSEAEQIIVRELRAAVALTIDTEFIATATAGVTPMTSQGLTADVANLYKAVSPAADSRLYFVVGATAAISLATARTNGLKHFPDAGVQGGSIDGIPVLVTNAMQAATIALVDAARIGGGLEEAAVAISAKGTVEMDTAPTMSAGVGSPIAPVAAQTVSLWQTNSIGVMALQSFGCTALRSGAVATVFTGGSP